MKKLFCLIFVIIAVKSSFANDKTITCENLMANQNGILNSADIDFYRQNIDFECENSLLKSEFFIKMFDLANEIRADSWECQGSAYKTKQNEFKFDLLKASFAPEIFAKNLPLNFRQMDKQNRAYFRYWAHLAISNFELFNQFWLEFNNVMPKLIKFYEDKGNSQEKSKIYAQNILAYVLNFAVGDFNIADENPDLSEFGKNIANLRINNYELLNLFYAKKFSQNELDEALKIALLYKRDVEILSALIKMGANINTGSESALFFAIKDMKSVKFLLENGAQIDYKNPFAKTALFYAVEFNDHEMAQFLIQNGADVNAKYISKSEKMAIESNLGATLPFFQNLCGFEHTNRTLLMHAAQHADVKMLKILLNLGADLKAIDDLNFSVLDYAKFGKNEENIKFLQEIMR